MFCFNACSCTRRAASGFKLALNLNSPASGASVKATSANCSLIRLRAASKVAASRKRNSMVSPLREMPLWRMFFSRSTERRSPAVESIFLLSAAAMSTCSMKCTPPRKSRPRYMGAALSDVSHWGEREIRFRATTYGATSGSGTRAFWITSLALSWLSVSAKRTLSELFSRLRPVGSMAASLSACTTLVCKAASTL